MERADADLHDGRGDALHSDPDEVTASSDRPSLVFNNRRFSMNNQLQAQSQAGQSLGLVGGGSCRENAQTIAKSQFQLHDREASAWRWIDAAMEAHRPTAEEEEAL